MPSNCWIFIFLAYLKFGFGTHIEMLGSSLFLVRYRLRCKPSTPSQRDSQQVKHFSACGQGRGIIQCCQLPIPRPWRQRSDSPASALSTPGVAG
ncbi:hypothetical protein BC2230_21172 [Burkholderia cepacia]